MNLPIAIGRNIETVSTVLMLRPEYALEKIVVWLDDLGCLDAPGVMPAGGVRRSTLFEDSQIQHFFARGNK